MNYKKAVKSTAKKLLKAVGLIETEKKQVSKTDINFSEEEKTDLETVKRVYSKFDRDHIWAFISGQYGQDFRGNPKYMFVYINKYRPDIKAYWICNNDETIEQVKKLGYEAYRQDSPAAQFVANRTGVLVAEQVKFTLPDGFNNIKYINLWHGVGFKKVERRLHSGDISMDLARKYVMRSAFYRDNQLMNATCPFIEEAYALDVGVDSDKFLRVGYPRCLYQQNFDPVVTYDHDLRKRKGLPKDTKLVVYTPTYRAKLGGTFSKAFTDFDRLYRFCEENNILFIFKVHPNMEKEVGFHKAWEKYGDLPHFLFWDNRDDFYEIMHTMDLAIIDYSGMVSDMIAMGIKHYIRYIFDYDEYMQSVDVYDNYFEMTTGEVCYDFDHLLELMKNFEQRDETADIARLNEKLWSYSEGKDDFERIIDAALSFNPVKRSHPTLYSFDVFDTLFSRKVLSPVGVFYYVREKMIESGAYSFALAQSFPRIRHAAEMNVREYYAKSTKLRDDERVEITFDEIYTRIQNVYGLSDTQTEQLKVWELEAELNNVIPLKEQIDRIKALLADNQTVVLISDMYLSKEFVQKLLYRADPILAELPLFLSSEYGVLKTSQKLFFEVYKSFKPYYDFEKWIHYGDNDNADFTQARKFKITAHKIDKPVFNTAQNRLTALIDSYDAYLVAAMEARMCNNICYAHDEFVISFISLCFVPYIDWVLRDAQRRGYETLYFVSRDGYHLKRIADKIIERRGLNFKTKYIYASRRTWRIPSFVHEVDDSFWEDYGSFGNIASKSKLLGAMNLTEELFKEIFPYIDLDNIDFSNRNEMNSLRDIFKNSDVYKDYLLKTAAKERVLVSGYLKQEIDFNESFAFVEYYGRGYTQDCLVNLVRDITKDDRDVVFYYSRSVLPSANGAIRHNFTTNDAKQYFIESIFANMPYKSIEEYYEEDGVIKPVIESISYNRGLFDAMDRILPEFADNYASLELRFPEETDRALYDFVFTYYNEHLKDMNFINEIAELKDSVTLYGNKRELAPPYTMETLDKIANKEIGRGSLLVTTSISMSVARADEKVKNRYFDMFQILPGEPYGGGRLLSNSEIKTNNSFKQKFNSLNKRAAEFKNLYEEAVGNTEVSDTVLILTEAKKLGVDYIDKLEENLKKQDRYSVKTLMLSDYDKERDAELAAEIAAARFVVTSKPISILCKTVFRNETREIFAVPAPFTVVNKGFLQKFSLRWETKYKQLISRNDFAVMQIPSEYNKEFFERSYCTRSDTDISLMGSYMTDVYFDPDYKKNAEKKLKSLFPDAVGKKRILYIPKWRERSDCAAWMDMLDLEALKKLVGEEYVVIVRLSASQVKHNTVNELSIPGFSKLLNKGIALRELMTVCDVVVGDYNDTFFETPILRKPAFSTAYDYDTYMGAGNRTYFANKFEDLLFCPIVESSYELAEQLKKIDNYDFGPMDAFREKYLEKCDGKSMQRLVEYIKNN